MSLVGALHFVPATPSPLASVMSDEPNVRPLERANAPSVRPAERDPRPRFEFTHIGASMVWHDTCNPEHQ